MCTFSDLPENEPIPTCAGVGLRRFPECRECHFIKMCEIERIEARGGGGRRGGREAGVIVTFRAVI